LATSSHTPGRSGHDSGDDHGHEHDHDHGHGHGHHHGPRGHGKLAEHRKSERRRLWIALALTLVIALAEAIGGYFANSLALMSDAGHMLTDLSALGLSLMALWFSGKPANVRKTYGYYRLEILSALVNGVILLAITIVIVLEAWSRLRQPAPIHIGTTIGIAAIGLTANLASMSFLHGHGTMNVRSAFLHVLGDAMASLGVIIGAAIIWGTGWLVVDPLISVGISIVIVVGAYRLVKDAVDVLLEATPEHVDLEAVRALMAKATGVVAVHDLHVWTISSGIYALSVHLVVDNAQSCNNDAILSEVKHELFDRFGIDHTTIQIESETYAHLGEVH
jgi:cobalt-zinc-cadmium efflux system protein